MALYKLEYIRCKLISGLTFNIYIYIYIYIYTQFCYCVFRYSELAITRLMKR